MTDLQRLVGRTIVSVDDTYPKHSVDIVLDDGTVLEITSERSYDQGVLVFEWAKCAAGTATDTTTRNP